MKKRRIVKITGIVFWVLLTIVVILFQIARYEYGEVHKEEVTHCTLYLDKNIDSLTSIDFVICDSTYNYTINQLKDTISENLGISDESFPCAVYVKYNFSSGEKRIIAVDSFNAGGYSGTNIYIFKKDTIVYRYAP